jgi:hypothetical protein
MKEKRKTLCVEMNTLVNYVLGKQRVPATMREKFILFENCFLSQQLSIISSCII